MKKLSKKEEYLRKKRLIKNIKTIALVSMAVILVSLTVFVICFYYYTKETMGEVTYPKSPLTRMMDTTYSYVADDNLPVMIQCPSIPVLMNVGGSERYITDNGVVFAYGNGLYISVYETLDTAYSILSGQFVSDLYAGEDNYNILYENAVTDIGYFNGYPAEFQCGDCQILNSSGIPVRDIYVVSMTMELGLEKKIMLVVSTTDKKSLYDAGILLQSIGYTVMDTSGTNYIDTEGDKPSERYPDSTVTEGAINQPLVPDSGTIYKDQPAVKPEPTVRPEPTATPEKAWTDYTVQLSQTYERGTFVLEYQNSDTTPIDAVLYSPDGMTTYNPSYLNDGLDGTIRFMVQAPQPGIWTIKINAGTDLGTFSTYCVDSDSYIPSKGAASAEATAMPSASAQPTTTPVVQ